MAATDDWAPVTPRESRITRIPGSWHNPTSELLRQLSSDVWVIERGYVDHGIDFGAKTTIIRLPDDRLFVHSGLPLNAELKAAVDALGTVTAVVAPNTQHVDFVKCWKKCYPEATCLAPPGLKAKRTDVPFNDELNADGSPHEAYKDDAGSIQQVYLGSCPIMGETVFFHVPSKTLLVTDIIYTFPDREIPFWTRVAKFVLKHFFSNVHSMYLVKDKRAFAQSLSDIEAFGFETLVPCHGDVITEDALTVFKRWFHRL